MLKMGISFVIGALIGLSLGFRIGIGHGVRCFIRYVTEKAAMPGHFPEKILLEMLKSTQKGSEANA